MAIHLDNKIKLLRHFDRVQGIISREFLPPITVDVDIFEGKCNIDCVWCSQAVPRESKPRSIMPVETMRGLGPFCEKWGVKAWKIAGVSEPTLHPNIDTLLSTGHESGISMGLTTNGVLLDRLKNLHLLTWLGISLDATTSKTWSLLKKSPEKNFNRIVDNIKRIRDEIPNLDVTIKFLSWSESTCASKNDFYPMLTTNKGRENRQNPQKDNLSDAEQLAEFAEKLGCGYRLNQTFSKNASSNYLFDKCLVTPLAGVFGADHKFHLCCDARNVYVLTDDYTRKNWQEIIDLWGSEKHKSLINSINPKTCFGCGKSGLCSVMENVVLDGKYTDDYQVNFTT